MNGTTKTRIAAPAVLLTAAALAWGALASPSQAAGADVTARYQDSATLSLAGTVTQLSIGVSGRHTISAKLWARALPGGTARRVDCVLEVGGDVDGAVATVPAGGFATLALNTVTQTGGTVRLKCHQTGGGSGTELGMIKITAVKADTLDNASIL